MSAQNNVSGLTAVSGFTIGLHESWANSPRFSRYSKIKVHVALVTLCDTLLFLEKGSVKRLPFEQFPRRECLITTPDRVVKRDLNHEPSELIDPRGRHQFKLLAAFEIGDKLHIFMKVPALKRNWPGLYYAPIADTGVDMGGLVSIALNLLRPKQPLAA